MNSIIRKRIGKDLTIQMSVLTNGEALSLEGRLLTVELRHELLINACQKMGYTVSGNRITIKWYGKDQRHLGKYHLTIWENYKEAGQTVVDVCNPIELVKSTCLENDMNNGLDIDTVDLGVTDLAIGIKGESAYETWLKQGHVGSEADFIAWLRQPSEGAASKALEAADRANKATESVKATERDIVLSEQLRMSAELERNEAEKARINAEQIREQSESARVTGENKRDKAETARDNAERKRVDAEAIRSETELTRNTAEGERIVSEQDRQKAEDTRVNAEQSRVNSEESRAQEELKRETAESERQTATAEAIGLAGKATKAANDAAIKANEEVNKIPALISAKLSVKEVKGNGNIVLEDGTGTSHEYMAATPSGDPLHYMYEASGAKWNEATGLWELNGLTDITNELMRICYNESQLLLPSAMAKTAMRTNFVKSRVTANYSYQFDITQTFWFSAIEVANIGNIMVSKAAHAFYSCSELRKVIGIWDVSKVTYLGGLFQGCQALVDVQIKGLSANISFAQSALLSIDSLLYIISNAVNKSITITLHPDAYARAMSDSSITAALAAKPLITIAK